MCCKDGLLIQSLSCSDLTMTFEGLYAEESSEEERLMVICLMETAVYLFSEGFVDFCDDP